MKWGPKAGQKVSDGEFLSRLAEKEGIVATAVKEQPKLDIVEQFYWEAFIMLHLSRPSTGFGPGPIPLTEIKAFTELMEIPKGDDLYDFVRVVRKMDRAYLEQVTKK